MDDPANWTDVEVRAYLLSQQSPLECWCVGDIGGYGFISKGGTVFACADDWEERANRIAAYLKTIGARSLDEASRQAGPVSVEDLLGRSGT